MPNAPDPTNDLNCLAYADHLLVWSLRACATGRWPCAMLEREYRDACGPAGAAEARNALRAFAKALETQSRRTIVLGAPGGVAVTADEQRLLAVYAAAQAGDRRRCEAELGRLLGAPPNPYLFPLAQALGRALAAGGHRFGPPPLELVAQRPARGVFAEAAA